MVNVGYASEHFHRWLITAATEGKINVRKVNPRRQVDVAEGAIIVFHPSQVKITLQSALLQWARQRTGLSEADLGKKLGIKKVPEDQAEPWEKDCAPGDDCGAPRSPHRRRAKEGLDSDGLPGAGRPFYPDIRNVKPVERAFFPAILNSTR